MLDKYEIQLSSYAQKVFGDMSKEIQLAKTNWFNQNPNASEEDWKKYFMSTIEWKELCLINL